MAQARGGNRSVYFVDASHVVRASFLGRVWCFVRLYVRAASGRQRYNVLGALNAVTHELVTEVNATHVTAPSACALLRAIATRRDSVPVTLVLDNARYPRCAWVTGTAQGLGIELLFRPSYSPNRKVIEHRRRQLPARVAVIPEAVAVEVDGGAFAPAPHNVGRELTTPRTRKTRSRLGSRSRVRRPPATRAPNPRTRSNARVA